MSGTFRYVALDPFKIDNETFVDKKGDPINDATAFLTVRRSVDYLYMNAIEDWEETPTLLPMIKVDDIVLGLNSPGDWFFNFVNGLEKGEYKFVVIDTSDEKAENAIQQSKAIVDDELVRLSKISAAGVVGDADYDEETSKLSLFEYNNNTKVLAVFDIKDAAGNPAGENSWLAKKS